MKKVIPTIGLLLAVMVLLCACGGTAEPTAAEEIQLPIDTAWEMSAVLVDAQGQVLETMTLTAKVQVWEQEGEVSYALNFHYPANIYNSVTGTVPKSEQEKPYSWCAGTGVETGEAGKRGPALYAAFDYIKGCFIADFDDDKDVYLIASHDLNADFNSLWTYFKDFIQMRPEEFPNIY